MRPAGRAQYQSLYFDYPSYDFVRPPQMDGASEGPPVAIVGAGPVGLVAALELARYAIPSVVLDEKHTVNDGSRAVCLARHSMEQLQQLGIADTFTSKALGWTHGSSYFRGQCVYRLEMPHSGHERFLPMYNLQQQYMEQYLADAARQHPLIDVRFASRVVDIVSDDESVGLTVATPAGSYPLHTTYCLAADGAHSTVRRRAGLPLKGDAYEGRYVIADIQLRSDFPTERRAFFDPPANPGATLLMHKQPDDIWRVDWQLRPGEDETAALEETALRRKIGAILAMVGEDGPWELEWWSIYRAFTLCLDDYRHGGIFFLGDAAHLVPIFGVRGLNSGLADAGNIAWKLAAVLNGSAPAQLLDSYTPERRGATMDVFANARKSTQFMTPPTVGYQLMRDAVLSLSLRYAFARPFLNPRQSAPYNYDQSALTSFLGRDKAFTAGPAAGAPLIDHRLADGSFLLDYLPNGFFVLAFCRDRSAIAEWKGLPGKISSALASAHPLTVLIVCAKSRAPNSDMVLNDADGGCHHRYGAGDGSCYLVRPDRHVAARWQSLNLAELRSAFQWALSIQGTLR
ncbi:MAG: monooxygenase [Gammaproteobacteria bacterium]|nr:monooxygenase [Gammaproteobacteria bacterium]